MNVRHTASWFCIIAPSLVILAAAFLLADNWDNVCTDFHFFFKTHHGSMHVGPLMLLSAMGGALVYLCARLLVIGIKGVRKAKLAAAALQLPAQGQENV
jgi:uncharacterized integral membrane protein